MYVSYRMHKKALEIACVEACRILCGVSGNSKRIKNTVERLWNQGAPEASDKL